MFDRVYSIKFFAELGFGILTAVVVYLGTQLAATDLETIDPAAFLVALLTGSARVAVAVVINAVRTALSD